MESNRSINSTLSASPMETNINNPQDEEKDSASNSPPILPQTAVRQSTEEDRVEFTRTMHMSFTESEEETSTSSSTEEGLSSTNVSGYIPNTVFPSCSMTEENNEAEEEEEGELEEEFEEEYEEGVEEEEKKEEVPKLSSVHDVRREMFATALVVTSDIQNDSNRLYSECARASVRISVLVRERHGLGMLALLEKSSSSDTKLVQDKRELKEIHESVLEKVSDPHISSNLLSTYSKQGKNARDGDVIAIFGEVSELEDLLGDYPQL